MHDYEIYSHQWIQNAMLNKKRWRHRNPKKSAKSVESASIRDSDDTHITSPQKEQLKNVTLSAKLFFFTTERSGKRDHTPLRSLGSSQIAVTYQMLHWCNILTQ